jgi:hypothetical protein
MASSVSTLAGRRLVNEAFGIINVTYGKETADAVVKPPPSCY